MVPSPLCTVQGRPTNGPEKVIVHRFTLSDVESGSDPGDGEFPCGDSRDPRIKEVSSMELRWMQDRGARALELGDRRSMESPQVSVDGDSVMDPYITV